VVAGFDHDDVPPALDVGTERLDDARSAWSRAVESIPCESGARPLEATGGTTTSTSSASRTRTAALPRSTWT